jgi:hypothetical protein
MHMRQHFLEFLLLFLMYSHVSDMLANYKSLSKTVSREDGVRMLRHTMDMLGEVQKLRTMDERSESVVTSRSSVYTDTIIQVN